MINLYYLILVHDNPQQLVRLIDGLAIDNAFFYIHVDKKVALRPFIQASKSKKLKRIKFIRNRIKCKWGGISIVKATILLLKSVHQNQSEKGYVMLMSGQHYPIKSNNYILEYLTSNYGKIFMETSPLSKSSWQFGGLARIENYYFFPSYNRKLITSIPELNGINSILQLPGRRRKLFAFFLYFLFNKKRKHPDDIVPHIGSQWWCLPIEVSAKIVQFIKDRPELLYFHRFSFAPDEMYFQTIISALNTANLTENIVQDNLVYMDWEKHNYCQPALLNKNYLPTFKSSNKLFARKFDNKSCSSIYDLIDTHCRK